jgi:hypothetical protein
MRIWGVEVVAVTVALLAGPSSWSQDGPTVLKLRGLALNLTGVGTGRSGELEIGVERWSGDDERERLRKALADGGVAGLTRALSAPGPRAGYVRTERGGTLDLKFAEELSAAEGERRIVLVTDRVGAPADGSRPDADTYDFLVVEVLLDKGGRGEARTAGPERLLYHKETQTPELKEYGVMPVWVKDLQVISPK